MFGNYNTPHKTPTTSRRTAAKGGGATGEGARLSVNRSSCQTSALPAQGRQGRQQQRKIDPGVRQPQATVQIAYGENAPESVDFQGGQPERERCALAANQKAGTSSRTPSPRVNTAETAVPRAPVKAFDQEGGSPFRANVTGP